jgi:hypothetical protein
MNEMLVTFGRGIIKFLMSLFVGTGVGLMTFGIAVNDIDAMWTRPGPPSGFFVATGAGLLSTAIMMALLFFLPRLWNAPAQAVVKRAVYEEELAA